MARLREVSVTVRAYEHGDMLALDRLRAAVYPGEPKRDPRMWWAFPPLVVPRKAEIIAATTFTLSPDAKRGYVCYGVDHMVHPDHRRQGIGTLLHEERCRIARELGAIDFLGTITPDNDAMKAILVASGGRHISSGAGRDFYVVRL